MNAESFGLLAVTATRELASMEPRSFERGKPAVVVSSGGRIVVLQWSRVRLNAERLSVR